MVLILKLAGGQDQYQGKCQRQIKNISSDKVGSNKLRSKRTNFEFNWLGLSLSYSFRIVFSLNLAFPQYQLDAERSCLGLAS